MKSAEHTRFDAAHELAHLVLHKHAGPHRKDAEKEANKFAASFLMPSADVISIIPFINSIDSLRKVKHRWRVSMMALAYRLHELKIISDWQYRMLCIQMTKRGYRISEPDGIMREESPIWKFVLQELWKERCTRAHIANDLNLPMHEITNLISGLMVLVSSNSKVDSNV